MEVGAGVEDWLCSLYPPALSWCLLVGSILACLRQRLFFGLAFHYLAHTAMTMDQPKGYST